MGLGLGRGRTPGCGKSILLSPFLEVSSKVSLGLKTVQLMGLAGALAPATAGGLDGGCCGLFPFG